MLHFTTTLQPHCLNFWLEGKLAVPNRFLKILAFKPEMQTYSVLTPAFVWKHGSFLLLQECSKWQHFVSDSICLLMDVNSSLNAVGNYCPGLKRLGLGTCLPTEHRRCSLEPLPICCVFTAMPHKYKSHYARQMPSSSKQTPKCMSILEATFLSVQPTYNCEASSMQHRVKSQLSSRILYCSSSPTWCPWGQYVPWCPLNV